MPSATIRHAQGAGFLSITNRVQIDGRWQNIEDHLAARNRDHPGSKFLPPPKLKADRIHGVNVASDPQQSIGKGIHDPDKVPMGFMVKMTPVNQVNLFTRG